MTLGKVVKVIHVGLFLAWVGLNHSFCLEDSSFFTFAVTLRGHSIQGANCHIETNET